MGLLKGLLNEGGDEGLLHVVNHTRECKKNNTYPMFYLAVSSTVSSAVVNSFASLTWPEFVF